MYKSDNSAIIEVRSIRAYRKQHLSILMFLINLPSEVQIRFLKRKSKQTSPPLTGDERIIVSPPTLAHPSHIFDYTLQLRM